MTFKLFPNLSGYDMKTINCPDMVPGEERRYMKLEELLGEELYSKVKEKIDEVNNKETFIFCLMS